MKTHICIWLVLAAAGALSAQTQNPAVLLEEGIYTEETMGDLDRAISIYEQVIRQDQEAKQAIAQATYRIGLCLLRKGEPDKAAEYFRKVTALYSEFPEIVKQAKEQLAALEPEDEYGLYGAIPHAVLGRLSALYGQVCSKAGMKGLYSNCHIHYVDEDMRHYAGGFGYYQNNLGAPLQQKIRLSGTTNPDLLYFDISGRRMNMDIVANQDRPGFYDVYWTPEEVLAPSQMFLYGWTGTHEGGLLPKNPSTEAYTLVMNNHFGERVMETFYLVVPDTTYLSDMDAEYTGAETVDDLVIYYWTNEVPPNTTHKVTVQLIPMWNYLTAEKLPIESITLGDRSLTVDFVKSMLGTPEKEKDHYLAYDDQYGISFFINGGHNELRLNPGFVGTLSTGISLNSTAQDVFEAYGQPDRTEQTTKLTDKFETNVLFRMGTYGRINYKTEGLTFWFNGDTISQIVLLKGTVQGRAFKAAQWVEDFFSNNFQDITSRKTLAWGEPTVDENGNVSIRYTYEARIWDRDTIIGDMIFTFDKDGNYISREDVVDTATQAGLQRLVMKFFQSNYRDITSRKSLEWGEPVSNPDGTVSIRYTYEATIRGKNTIINDQIFTFNEDGSFVSVEKISDSPGQVKATDAFTPQAAILGFMEAAIRLDTDKAMSYVASNSHDYNDIRDIFTNPENPFYLLFKNADAASVRISRADITGDQCSAAWIFTLRESVNIEGELILKAGDQFPLDGGLQKFGEQWLITGI